MFIKELDHGHNRLSIDDGIVIQDIDKTAAAVLDALVIALGDADIVLVLHDLHMWEVFASISRLPSVEP